MDKSFRYVGPPTTTPHLTVQFNPLAKPRRLVQSLDRLGPDSGRRGGDMTDDSAETVSQCFLQEAIVSSTGVGIVDVLQVFVR